MGLFDIFFQKKDDLTKYSIQLSKLTEDIDKANKKLQSNKTHNHYYKIFILSFVSIVISGLIQWMVPKIPLLYKSILNAITLIWPFAYYKYLQQRHSKLLKKITVLRNKHNKTLEDLKNKTSFYNTAAIINRYSGGEHGDQDEVKIMDEEVSAKKQQLDDIRKELQENSTKSKEETDKWFDKCLNALAGGNMGPIPQQQQQQLEQNPDPISSQTMIRIICPECSYDSGLYTLVSDKTCIYNCPECEFNKNIHDL